MALETLDPTAYGLEPIQFLNNGMVGVLTEWGSPGFTNTNILLVTRDEEMLLRIPNTPDRRTRTIQDTQTELEFTGFLQAGGSWHMRTPPEQSKFSILGQSFGLHVLPLEDIGDGKLTMPFIERATPLRDLLLRGNLDVVPELLDHLRNAHNHGVIFGDTWTNNTLFDEQGHFYEIDYDIALEGPYAKEFELAKYLFHIIHFAKDRTNAVSLLANYFSTTPIHLEYDTLYVNVFIRNYMNHYTGQLYEGLPVADVDAVIPLIRSLEVLQENISILEY